MKQNRTKKRRISLLLAGMCWVIAQTFAGCAGEEAELTLAPGSGSEVETAAETEESGETAENTGIDTPDQQEEDTEESLTVYVYVCGAVASPGVYELEEGSRVFEAIAAAGGLTEDADDRSLNQAQKIEDGMQITVYTAEEAAEHGTDTPSGQTGNGKVNLNTADREQLMTLPGIGETKAAAILEYRETHGSFTSVEELMNISGIKEGVYEKIREKIEV